MSKIPVKKLILVLITLFLLAALLVALYLVKQRQEIRKKASTPTGTAAITIAPTSKQVRPGEKFSAQVKFDSKGIAISAVTTQLHYSFTGTSPAIQVESVTPNPTLAATGDWSFPIKTATIEGSSVYIKIAAINLSPTGYLSSGETLLATINFKAITAGGEIIVSFDPTESKISAKATGEDFLLTPTTTASYSVVGGPSPTSTPTPVSSPTPSPTLVPEEVPTSTPTPPLTLAPSPTATPTLTPTSTPTPISTPTQTSGATPTPAPIGGSTSTSVRLTSISSGETISTTRPTFSGTAAPGAKIIISIKSPTITGTTYADSSGNWSWTPSESLTAGSHTITVTATDSQGNTSTASATFTVGSLPKAGIFTPTLLLLTGGLLLFLMGIGL